MQHYTIFGYWIWTRLGSTLKKFELSISPENNTESCGSDVKTLGIMMVSCRGHEPGQLLHVFFGSRFCLVDARHEVPAASTQRPSSRGRCRRRSPRPRSGCRLRRRRSQPLADPPWGGSGCSSSLGNASGQPLSSSCRCCRRRHTTRSQTRCQTSLPSRFPGTTHILLLLNVGPRSRK